MANLAPASKWKSNAVFIASWYILSTSLSMYNKALLTTENYGVDFPLLMSAIHSGVHTIITRTIMKRYCKEELYPLSIKDYVLKVIPCSLAAVAEISLSNASLVHTTLSLYTMLKSSTPVWMLLFSSLFELQTPSRGLLISTSLIIVGVLLTIDGESSNINVKGLILVLSAAVASGLRWTLIQLLLKQTMITKPEKQKRQRQQLSPIATMYHMSPVMFVTMLLLSWHVEQPMGVFSKYAFDKTSLIVFLTRSIAIMATGGVLAFLMTLSEIYLVDGTSTITLSLAGISKEILLIGLSIVIYGDVLSTKTYLGLLISIVGIFRYNYSRHNSTRKRQIHAQDSKKLKITD